MMIIYSEYFIGHNNAVQEYLKFKSNDILFTELEKVKNEK